MLAAKKGREEQLKTLERFLAGEEEVGFMNHQDKTFMCQYDPTTYTRQRAPTKLVFDRRIVFLDAAAKGDDEAVAKMIDEGMDPDCINGDGLTALHQACIENNLKLVSVLLDKGATINVMDNDWWTPLHAASACGHWRIVRKLVQNGADLTAVNADGDLPIDVAEGEKVKDVLEEEMKQLGMDDEAYLEEMRDKPHKELMQYVKDLVEEDGFIDEKRENGATALHVAACNGWQDVVEYLLSQGATVNAKDNDKNTPLHLAAFFQHYRVVEILGKHGADPHAKNLFWETPAIMTDDVTMIRLLKGLMEKKKVDMSKVVEDSRPRLNSSVKRSRLLMRESLAKRDTQSEHKTIESNYADLSFAGRKKSNSNTSSPLKPADVEITYAELDHSNSKRSSLQQIDDEERARQEQAKDLYAMPVKKTRTPKTAAEGSTTSIDSQKKTKYDSHVKERRATEFSVDNMSIDNDEDHEDRDRAGSLGSFAEVKGDRPNIKKEGGGCCVIS